MNSFWQSPALVFAILAWLAAPPATLGEASQREAMRRRMMPKATAHLTNLGQPPEVLPPVVPTLAPPVPEALALTPPPAAPVAVPAQEEKGEHWWRARAAAARAAIARDQLMTDALQSRINALQRDVVNEDNPVLQTKLRQDLGKALAEFDSMTKQIDTDRKALAALQEEARRADVPPGWIR